MTYVMDRAFRDYARTLPDDGRDVVAVERAFKAALVWMIWRIGECSSDLEFERLRIAVLREAKEFMETIHCTCGKCPRDRPGTIVPGASIYREPS